MGNAQRARILVLTGGGKGKTTSALGMLLRALGHGHKVLLARFCKAAESGELPVLHSLRERRPLIILGGDCGMTPPPDHPDFPKHAACARELFERVRAASRMQDMIILDEVCGAVARGLLAEDSVLQFLDALLPGQSVILTGRGASARLLGAADTASEIRSLKHGHEAGIAAQDGIEK